MAEQLEVVKDTNTLAQRLDHLRQLDPTEVTLRDAVVISEVGSGILRFANSVFHGESSERIYAKHYKREPAGRGAHFDIYGGVSAQYYPWIAVYNLAGRATLTAALLDDDSAQSYFKRFPVPNDVAYEARRHYSAITLADEQTEVMFADIEPYTGLVLLQREEGPHVIHEIKPKDSLNPGEFIKLVLPAATERSMELAEQDGMIAFDQLITDRLVSDISSLRADLLPDAVIRAPETPPSRRPCNLD